MTLLDRMNSNFDSSVSISEMHETADFMRYLNRMDEQAWLEMREAMNK